LFQARSRLVVARSRRCECGADRARHGCCDPEHRAAFQSAASDHPL